MIKTARQLKDLIRNLSKEKVADAQILMRNYMMERFLERISLSEYRDKFILKGGMLVAALVGLDCPLHHGFGHHGKRRNGQPGGRREDDNRDPFRATGRRRKISDQAHF